jgi:FAD/FMN-containing dehydrogenase
MIKPVSNIIENKLRECLPESVFRELTNSYLEEPRGRHFGIEGLLLTPDNTNDVVKIVRICSDHNIGIVPYGGGTGLVGGQIMPDGPKPVILSLERMNKVRDVWLSENIMIAEAGVILKDIQDLANSSERIFPLSLASEGSARIGGNLATNAGGINVVRYGNTRDLCLGIEGTLGIITAASLKLFPKPKNEASAFFVVKDPRAAIELFSLCRDRLGTDLSAFELISSVGLQFLKEVGPDVILPFSYEPEWMVLLDVGCHEGTLSQEVLELLFEDAYDRDLVMDGVISQSIQQRDDFWKVRESIPEANHRTGAISSSDLSVPISRIPEFISRAEQRLSEIGEFRINCFGHVGDGNIHYNVFPLPGESRSDRDHDRKKVKKILYDIVSNMDGSFSAEHGIGRLKTNELSLYSDPTKIELMKSIKVALDPKGIMNPGVILRTE